MPHTMVIFGASGDLTSRKLVPALYQAFRKGRLPADVRIVGFSRTVIEDSAWRAALGETTARFVGGEFQRDVWERFAANIFYHPGDIGRADDFHKLRRALDKLEGDQPATRVYYLATAPTFFEPTIEQLGTAGLAYESAGPRRIVVEKPFGTDLASGRRLNATLHRVFSERQIFRIDHYLGKETVQNILVLRFANTIFEPVWNRNYIQHVEITAAEKVEVGRRAGHYESTGVLRDMFQNHLLQLLTFIAMEPPSRFEADAVRNEKVKVLDSVRRFNPSDVARDTFRAQYHTYGNEPGVVPGSQTATFAALKLSIENWRWQDVPFFIRSGKAMNCRTTQIVIQFREPPHRLFKKPAPSLFEANRLVLQIQPAEGIQLHFQTKVPDAGMQLRLTDLDFRFNSRFQQSMPEAYERLLLDVLAGDNSLFARSDEVELQWAIIDPILRSWETTGEPPLYFYDRGTWGPAEVTDWIAGHGGQWLDICPAFQ
jgi:glucose-6-phosphate 1-dehydrogenase